MECISPSMTDTPGSAASSDGTCPARRMPPKMPMSSGLPMRENIFNPSIAACVSGVKRASFTPKAAQRSAISDAPAPEVDSAPSAPDRLP